jgi:hypothetical protein
VGAALGASQIGCTRMLATAALLIKGTDTDPEFQGLKNKRIAIVCRPVVQLQYSNNSVGNDIATELATVMRQKMKKIELIDPDRVAEWVDGNDWDDYTEIGKGLDADVIIGIDLSEFRIYQSQTLYQGKAKAQIKVYDMTKGGEVIYQKHTPQIVYPPNTGIPTQEMPEDEFRRGFVTMLADQVGRHFYAYDTRGDFARDVKAMK